MQNNPSERKKERKPLTIPLSEEALEVLGRMTGLSTGGLVFSTTGKTPLSEAALRKLLKSYLAETQTDHCVLHGFRSCLRIWAEKETNFGFAVLEKVLAHSPGGQVQAAYLQNEFLDDRRVIMSNWANYLVSEVNDE